MIAVKHRSALSASRRSQELHLCVCSAVVIVQFGRLVCFVRRVFFKEAPSVSEQNHVRRSSPLLPILPAPLVSHLVLYDIFLVLIHLTLPGPVPLRLLPPLLRPLLLLLLLGLSWTTTTTTTITTIYITTTFPSTTTTTTTTTFTTITTTITTISTVTITTTITT